MLPEGDPAHHFGGRFSERVTQKGFKIIGKQTLLKIPATQQIRAHPAGPRVRFAGPAPPQSAHAQKHWKTKERKRWFSRRRRYVA